jgi:hypothetical protein
LVPSASSDDCVTSHEYKPVTNGSSYHGNKDTPTHNGWLSRFHDMNSSRYYLCLFCVNHLIIRR